MIVTVDVSNITVTYKVTLDFSIVTSTHLVKVFVYSINTDIVTVFVYVVKYLELDSRIEIQTSRYLLPNKRPMGHIAHLKKNPV